MNKITKLTLETAQNFAPDVSNNTKNAKSPATSLLLGLIGFLFIVFFNPVASFAQGPGVIQNIFTGSGVEYVQKLCGTGN